MKKHLAKAIEELMDKILIWTVTFDGPNENIIWKTFIKPIVVKWFNLINAVIRNLYPTLLKF
jgi:hypothetical protein